MAGADPRRAYKTVPIAVEKVLAWAGLDMGQMDLIEIQEAFAAQVLADLNEMGVGPRDYPRVNVNGSGIGLGHPVGATGCRIMVTLLHAMEKRGKSLGMATLCGGGGVSMACALEMI